MFEIIGNIIGKKKDDSEGEGGTTPPPFAFSQKGIDSYQYPNLYEEADEMLQLSMLIYSISDLRSMARDAKRKEKLKSPEEILAVPMSLYNCLRILDDNCDAMKECLGETDHFNTINSLNLIHEKFQRHHEASLSSPTKLSKLVNLIPITSVNDRNVEVEELSPVLKHFGDENSDNDMVYAIGINDLRKRVTVVFRGSVTPTDFQKDAKMSLEKHPNPVTGIDSNQPNEIGIHQGFYDYLLRQRENGMNKYQEIIGKVEALFLECEQRRKYKLYVTGHSLGGALATIFSLVAAASTNSREGTISSPVPLPVTCISVASPRVGDRSFQKAFCRLEELGHLRHLRIANDRDPVTLMPSVTSKNILAKLSPMCYLAFKLMDSDFQEKGKFHHTGIKLRLARSKWELAFLGIPMINHQHDEVVMVDDDGASCGGESSIYVHSMMSRTTDSKSTKPDSFPQNQIPDVALHLGDAYTANLASVKNDLIGLSLNDLYKEKAASVFLKKSLNLS